LASNHKLVKESLSHLAFIQISVTTLRLHLLAKDPHLTNNIISTNALAPLALLIQPVIQLNLKILTEFARTAEHTQLDARMELVSP
jgi:hypothetical protein